TTAGSNYDTLLAVYTGNSVSSLTTIAKNDDVNTQGGILTSSVTFNATAGTFYKIAVDGWDADTGNIVLNWTLSNCTQAAPVVLTEEGTNHAVALDSVTRVRGPFPIIGLFNFSADQRTRVMLFTSDLGLNLNAGSDMSAISVRFQGIQLPVERVGTLSGVNNASYIIVRLTDQLPAGDLPVTVTLHGVTSTNTALIGIVR
ncbi:MAG TPA: hypothetical protein VEF04_13340, partial [Blastocatellia bacterium]|nr:hypothetical protein [Blastocatellia bacterium]